MPKPTVELRKFFYDLFYEEYKDVPASEIDWYRMHAINLSGVDPNGPTAIIFNEVLDSIIVEKEAELNVAVS